MNIKNLALGKIGNSNYFQWIDVDESYGRRVIERIGKELKPKTCLDIGCGEGKDLLLINKWNPKCKLEGFDIYEDKEINKKNIFEKKILNIENNKWPTKDNSYDLIIANQVLEHTKEIFWINHEVFRSLKIGGHFLIGVPNTLSLHNRILCLFGIHPTNCKLISAHVRAFSKRDTFSFYEIIGKNFLRISQFKGSQFYPFPLFIAKKLSNLFPSLAVINFYLIKKTGAYKGEFLELPAQMNLETNFFLG